MYIHKPQFQALSVKELGYVIGLFLGDCSFSIDRKSRHEKVCFSLNPKRDHVIINTITRLLKKIHLNPFYAYAHGAIDVRVNSKILVYVLSLLIDDTLNKKIINRDFAIGAISGLIDSDGYVYGKMIVIANTNQKIVSLVEKFCRELSIDVSSKVVKNKTPRGRITKITRIFVGQRFNSYPHCSTKLVAGTP